MAVGGICKAQESKLTLVYTLGVFAVNFGPAVVGPILDAFGPRLVSFYCCALTVLGLVLLGISHSGSLDALPYAAILIGMKANSHKSSTYVLCPGK